MPHADIKVWDIWVRLFHWLLLAAVAVAAGTGFFGPLNWLEIHLIAGISIAALVGARIVWGLLGGGFARFDSFAFSPRAVIAHVRGGAVRRFLGHNPIGAMMVFAVLAVLVAIVFTGVITLGGQDKQGPLAPFLSYAFGNGTRQIHKLLALLLMAMVAAHFAGVLFESRHAHENLTRSMLTGWKRPEPGVTLPPQGSPRLAAIVVLAGGVVIAAGVAALAALPGRGVPTMAIQVDTARECASCHNVYHPSLLPAASWRAILSDLGHHFGNDASLDPAIAARILGFLEANSAEHWDTLPAVRFRTSIDPNDPRRITATRFWRQRHREIADSVFAAAPVYRSTNCEACHADAASGRFSPQAIAIPPGSK